MRWTTEKPSRPGWYWWRSDDVAFKSRQCVVEVIKIAGDEPKYWLVNGVSINWSLGNTPGQWSGPIPPPEGDAI